MPVGSRKYIAPRLKRYETDGSGEAVDKYLALANKYALNPHKWLFNLSQPDPLLRLILLGQQAWNSLKLPFHQSILS